MTHYLAVISNHHSVLLVQQLDILMICFHCAVAELTDATAQLWVLLFVQVLITLCVQVWVHGCVQV